jgi:hypothetical protein
MDRFMLAQAEMQLFLEAPFLKQRNTSRISQRFVAIF